MEVEVWADVVCPWCYIGTRNLTQAVELAGAKVRVVRRAFQLDPRAPLATRKTIDVLGEKYHASAEQVRQMMARVTQVAADIGLEYHLDRTLSGNTLDAHRLLKHAEHNGLGARAWEHWYRAYFTDGRSLFGAEALQALGAEIGLEGSAQVLASTQYADEVEADLALARELGVNGVPFFVVDRSRTVSGAQSASALARLLA